MSKKNQKMSIGCRVLVSTVAEIDNAAEDEGVSRAEWIEGAIARQLGKRPRQTVQARLSRLEKQVAQLLPE